jgi:hypothetical protein
MGMLAALSMLGVRTLLSVCDLVNACDMRSVLRARDMRIGRDVRCEPAAHKVRKAARRRSCVLVHVGPPLRMVGWK